ncbi:MAG: peptidase M23 [Trueperaceae bacterium]|jgi:murein DD-endopeptidase MepM/ murein hydrolase activator NlpD|nr:peptidase M23 [Trueperaceae bacterium]|tara:strand:+ start:38360 stop:39355 length:996 start_codon:yes stop_codon:yes gene_type:complete
MNIRRFLLIAILASSGICAGSGYVVRVVQPGDTIGGIAEKYNISIDVLMQYNDLVRTVLQPGQILRLPYTRYQGGQADTAPTPPPSFRQHTLMSGETLTEVVEKFGISLDALVGANPDLSSLDLLPVGVELLIPPVGAEGLLVTIQPGETLIDILGQYRINPVALARINGITGPNDLQPGMMIYLPDVEPTRALERLAQVREEEQRYRWPVHGRITSYFGRRSLGMGTSGFHRGLDVAAPYGTGIHASRSGTVIFAGWSGSGYGLLTKIRHGGQEETWYAHHSQIHVDVGQYVNQGQIIGAIGSTGISTGPHLHFELHQRGRPVDPLTQLR